MIRIRFCGRRVHAVLVFWEEELPLPEQLGSAIVAPLIYRYHFDGVLGEEVVQSISRNVAVPARSFEVVAWYEWVV